MTAVRPARARGKVRIVRLLCDVECVLLPSTAATDAIPRHALTALVGADAGGDGRHHRSGRDATSAARAEARVRLNRRAAAGTETRSRRQATPALGTELRLGLGARTVGGAGARCRSAGSGRGGRAAPALGLGLRGGLVAQR